MLKSIFSMPRIRLLLLLTSLLMMLVPVARADEPTNTEGFRKAVALAGIREHQAALQEIAGPGGNRLAGTPRYDASAQYVIDKLRAAGYTPTTQEFTFFLVANWTTPVLQQVSPTAKSYVESVDFVSLNYSGSGDVTANVVAVDLNLASPAASTSGCEAADFAGFPAGAIALIQRGTCSFRIKADNAAAAGAAGAIIFNQGNAPDRMGVVNGRLSPPETLAAIPVVGISFAFGQELSKGILNGATGVQARVVVDMIAQNVTTRNVFAETAGGDPNHVIVVGAHLDSVAHGPGINDNGSGSAAILEVAETFAAQGREPRNKLRFAWFGAEEAGLLGSTYYVNQLSPAEKDKIELNLNFDMIGSPNFVRFVYDGNNSAFPAGPSVSAGPPGSGAIEEVFHTYFASQGLASAEVPLIGRSDYAPFITAGIPAGGLFTGAEGIKTAHQAAIYGGTAGAPYDPCYHQACDTFANTSDEALDQMSDAVAHAVLLFSKWNFDKYALADGMPTKGQGNGSEGGGLHDHDHDGEAVAE